MFWRIDGLYKLARFAKFFISARRSTRVVSCDSTFLCYCLTFISKYPTATRLYSKVGGHIVLFIFQKYCHPSLLFEMFSFLLAALLLLLISCLTTSHRYSVKLSFESVMSFCSFYYHFLLVYCKSVEGFSHLSHCIFTEGQVLLKICQWFFWGHQMFCHQMLVGRRYFRHGHSSRKLSLCTSGYQMM